jgi:hypothetical protein
VVEKGSGSMEYDKLREREELIAWRAGWAKSLSMACLFFSVPTYGQDHPPLRNIVIHNVTVGELQARCPDTYACAVADFASSLCDVFIPVNTPSGWPSRAAMLRHELRHCHGKGQD